MKKTALITGATSGIGRATAIAFAKQNINLVLCGRQQEWLDELTKELLSLTAVMSFNFDVRDHGYKALQAEDIADLLVFSSAQANSVTLNKSV